MQQSNYHVKMLWKILITVLASLAFAFIFVNGAVSNYPHWTYSIYDYAYDNAFLIGLPTVIIAIVAMWLNRPLVSIIASVIYILPIFHVMIYSSSWPEKLTAVYYLELILSISVIVISVLAYVKREKYESSPVPKEKSSIADEIKKYKQLLDDGVITNEEFEKKKKELLK